VTDQDEPPKPKPEPSRAEKRAAALRENLKRRKEQARDRQAPPNDPDKS
jgi:hypothetical protein